MFLWVCLWVILSLLPQVLVYDKWNYGLTLVASIYYQYFVLLKSKDSELIPALISGFATFEVLLYLGRLHLILLSGPDAFFCLPGP